jgi:type II secretory pathway predicted ATPase ExeA
MLEKIQNQFGLKYVPFTKEMSISNLFSTNALRDIQEYLQLAIKSEDFALISGSPGSGKSSSISSFLGSLDPVSFPHVYFTAEQYKIGEIAKLILHGFHAEMPYQGYAALRKLKDYILKMSAEKNTKPIVVIDEAQELPLTTLKALKNIVNFNADSKSYITIILCGQSELVDMMKSDILTSLRRRIRVRYIFKALSIEETLAYIDHQFKLAGLQKAIITDNCKSEIFKLSKGNISNINNICFDLLISAVKEKKDIIEPSLLDHLMPD